MALVFPVLMLVQMISAGAMGGGILSAVARSLGAGRRAEADRLPWYAAAIGLVLGLLTTGLELAFGPALYRAMGGEGASLQAAITYGGVVFCGAVLVWLFNALAAVIRGTGNMALPAIVISVGAAVLVPLSPALIYGVGPIPGLGIVGGGVAVLAYYAPARWCSPIISGPDAACCGPAPARRASLGRPLRDILRIGAVSSIVSATTNVTIAAATAFAGEAGRRRWRATARARGSNTCWCPSSSASARRSARWSAPASAPATGPAPCGWPGPGRRSRAG